MVLDATTDPAAVTATNAEYLIFYSSINEASQKMWCPDCVRVEDFVKEHFDREDGPSALIVFVGQREEWRGNSTNIYRGEPWNVTSVPTILRLRDNARLVDDDITPTSLMTKQISAFAP